LFFRTIGWLSVAGLGLGLAVMALDVVGVRFTHVTPTVGVLLFLGAPLAAGLAAAVETFFFSGRPRHEKWLEYVRQSLLSFRAIEVLLAHRRRRR
jgi:hypothetical protein